MEKAAAKLKLDTPLQLTSERTDYELHVCATAVPGADCVVAMFVVTDLRFGKAHSVARLFADLKGGFFAANTAADIAGATSGGGRGVDRASQDLLDRLVAEYGSCKLAEVQQKVDDVKTVLQDNVNRALQNVERVSDMETSAEDLRREADILRNSAGRVKSKMRCSYHKSTALLVGVAVVVLVVIIAPTAVYFSH